MCQNIDDFNRGAALILSRLYLDFPIPTLIQIRQLDDGSDIPGEARDARLRERRVIYSATLQFLADEGYLTYGDKAGPESDRGFAGVRLTSKGLAALNRTPESLRPAGPSLGDRLRGLAMDGTAEALRQAIGALMGG